MYCETWVAPVNIAVIKYWGKRNEELILPLNDSISVTLDTNELCATTSVASCADFKKNRMWLNGEEVEIEGNKRLQRCLQEIKILAGKKHVRRENIDWNIHICSENNFPTAAGLASSAAGYACLVYALASLYGVADAELSRIARQGSGSACRSMYGGFVRWMKGQLVSGNDSIARQLEKSFHWPELRILILVVNDTRKKTSSSKGMERSVQTSELLKYRTTVCVPKQVVLMEKAIRQRNFSSFAEITMRDSNQFHAVCLDTYPPCVYMNDVSQAIINFVHKYNEGGKKLKVAYTFDAGPNACLYTLDDDAPNVLSAIQSAFPTSNSSGIEIRGISVDITKAQPLSSIYGINPPEPFGTNMLKYIISTSVGDGPMKLSSESSLLNEHGLPANMKEISKDV